MSRHEEKIQGVHVWLVLWKAYDSMRKKAEASIAQLGLCYSDFAVLEVLLHKGPLPVNEIGPKVGLTSGSITVAVDRLAAKGLVKREDDPNDRRSRIVHLTFEGRELIEPAFEAHAVEMEKAMSALGQRDRSRLLALLKTLGQRSKDGMLS